MARRLQCLQCNHEFLDELPKRAKAIQCPVCKSNVCKPVKLTRPNADLPSLPLPPSIFVYCGNGHLLKAGREAYGSTLPCTKVGCGKDVLVSIPDSAICRRPEVPDIRALPKRDDDPILETLTWEHLGESSTAAAGLMYILGMVLVAIAVGGIAGAVLPITDKLQIVIGVVITAGILGISVIIKLGIALHSTTIDLDKQDLFAWSFRKLFDDAIPPEKLLQIVVPSQRGQLIDFWTSLHSRIRPRAGFQLDVEPPLTTVYGEVAECVSEIYSVSLSDYQAPRRLIGKAKLEFRRSAVGDWYLVVPTRAEITSWRLPEKDEDRALQQKLEALYGPNSSNQT